MLGPCDAAPAEKPPRRPNDSACKSARTVSAATCPDRVQRRCMEISGERTGSISTLARPVAERRSLIPDRSLDRRARFRATPYGPSLVPGDRRQLGACKRFRPSRSRRPWTGGDSIRAACRVALESGGVSKKEITRAMGWPTCALDVRYTLPALAFAKPGRVDPQCRWSKDADFIQFFKFWHTLF